MLEDLDQLEGFVLFVIGRTPVTLGGVIVGLAIIAAGFVAARIVAGVMRGVRGRTRHGAAALYIVEKLATYSLIVVAFIAGLTTVGLNLSSLAVFAGALGIGIGLGLQGVVKEFVSGLVLIFDRVLNVGDYIELEDGRRGLVQEIGPRAVRIRTNDSIDLVIPNSKFIEGPVVNWTLNNRTRRIHVPFGVAYGSDREKVREVVLEAARAVPFTMPETETEKSQVWLVGFGDSSLNFELLVWPTLDAVKRPATMHAAYTWAIAEALDRAGIEVPFPQRDLHVRSVFGHQGDQALSAFGLRPLERDKADTGQERPRPTTNDAAAELARPLPTPEPPDEPGSGAR